MHSANIVAAAFLLTVHAAHVGGSMEQCTKDAGDSSARLKKSMTGVCLCTGTRTCLVCELHHGRGLIENSCTPKTVDFATERIFSPLTQQSLQWELDGHRNIGFCLDCSLCVLPAALSGHSCIRAQRMDSRTGHYVARVSWYTQETGTIAGELCMSNSMQDEIQHGEGLGQDLTDKGRGERAAFDAELILDLEAACHFKGARVLREIVSHEEQESIRNILDSPSSDSGRPPQECEHGGWSESQAGRRKIEFGPKVNFKSEAVRLKGALPLPKWALSNTSSILAEARRRGQLLDFAPVELGVIEYDPCRGASIAPHIDDSWFWGERIVTCSLLAPCVMGFTRNSRQVLVHLPSRSLLVTEGNSRYSWLHSIRRSTIKSRRISLTYRELSAEFRSGGAREKDGRDVISAMVG